PRPPTSGPPQGGGSPSWWMKPDSPADPAGVRVRMLMSVNASGNEPPASPSITDQAIGAVAGAHSRPANPPTYRASIGSTSRNGWRMRTARTGTAREVASPAAEYTPSIAPAAAGPRPASVIQRGIQVNSA